MLRHNPVILRIEISLDRSTFHAGDLHCVREDRITGIFVKLPGVERIGIRIKTSRSRKHHVPEGRDIQYSGVRSGCFV